METQGLILVVAGLILAVGLVPILRDLRRDLMCVRNAVVLLYLLHFGVWPFVIVLSGEARFLRPLDSWADHLLTALLYALAGLVMFQLGHQSRMAEVFSRRLPSPAPLWNWRGARLLWLMLILVSLASFYYLMTSMGGWRAYLADLGTSRTQGLVGRWYFVWGATLFLGMALVLAYAMWVQNRSVSSSFRLGVAALLLGVVGLIIGYRSHAALPLLQLAIWHHYAVKRIRLGLRFTA